MIDSKSAWVKHDMRMGAEAYTMFGRIATFLEVPFVIAVGSRATDTYADNSDYDIVIVDDAATRATYATRVAATSAKLGVKIDYMVSRAFWPSHGILVDAVAIGNKKERKYGKI